MAAVPCTVVVVVDGGVFVRGGTVSATGTTVVVVDGACVFTAGRQRYDVILDIGGNASLSRLRRALTRTGTLVIVGGENGGRWTGMGRQLRAVALSPLVRQRLRTMMAKEHHTGLERLAELVAAGSLTPAIERSYPLNDAASAMRNLVSGDARGKLVISVGPF